jgi:hypothetical protein
VYHGRLNTEFNCSNQFAEFIQTRRRNLLIHILYSIKISIQPTLLFQIQEIKSSGQMHAQTVVVHELAKAPPAGPSTHSFQQGHWCFFSLSQKRGPGHGTWLHNKTHTQPGRFSATIDKWCTAHIEPCTADATNFLISCGGMYQVQTIIQLLLFFLSTYQQRLDQRTRMACMQCLVRFGKQFLNSL